MNKFVLNPEEKFQEPLSKKEADEVMSGIDIGIKPAERIVHQGLSLQSQEFQGQELEQENQKRLEKLRASVWRKLKRLAVMKINAGHFDNIKGQIREKGRLKTHERAVLNEAETNILRDLGYLNRLVLDEDKMPMGEQDEKENWNIRQEPVYFSIDDAEESKLLRLNSELSKLLSDFRTGDWAGKTRIDPLPKAVKSKQESDGRGDERERLPDWMSTASIESGEAQFLRSKNARPAAPVKKEAIYYKSDKSQEKLEADRAFVRAKWEKRKQSLPSRPNNPIDIFGNQSPSEKEEPEKPLPVINKSEVVAEPVLAPVVEQSRFDHPFLTNLETLIKSGQLNRFEIFLKAGLAYLRAVAYNQKITGEIALAELSQVSGLSVIEPSFDNVSRHKACKANVKEALARLGFNGLNVSIEIVQNYSGEQSRSFEELGAEDREAEKEEPVASGKGVRRPSGSVTAPDAVNQEPLPGWLKNDQLPVVKPQAGPRVLAVPVVNSAIIQDPVSYKIRRLESGMGLKNGQRRPGIEARQVLPNHDFFKILSSLNGRSMNYRILVKAAGADTVIKIIDQAPGSSDKGKEVASINVFDFVRFLNLKSLSTPFASGAMDDGVVGFRRQEFERGIKSALGEVGIFEDSLPEIVYQQF